MSFILRQFEIQFDQFVNINMERTKISYWKTVLIRIRVTRFFLAILIVFIFFFAAENFDSRSFYPFVIDKFFPFRSKQQRIGLLKTFKVPYLCIYFYYIDILQIKPFVVILRYPPI